MENNRLKTRLNISGSQISVFDYNNFLIKDEYFNRYSGNIHFYASKDSLDYINAAMFIVRNYQFSKPNNCWYLHEDTSEFCRYLKSILDWGKKLQVISRFYISGRGTSVYWKPDEMDEANIEVQCQIMEPFAQILCHFDSDEDVKDIEKWKNVRLVNHNSKARRYHDKYFNYATKTFIFEKKIQNPNPRPKPTPANKNSNNKDGKKHGKSGGKSSSKSSSKAGGKGSGKSSKNSSNK